MQCCNVRFLSWLSFVVFCYRIGGPEVLIWSHSANGASICLKSLVSRVVGNGGTWGFRMVWVAGTARIRTLAGDRLIGRYMVVIYI